MITWLISSTITLPTIVIVLVSVLVLVLLLNRRADLKALERVYYEQQQKNFAILTALLEQFSILVSSHYANNEELSRLQAESVRLRGHIASTVDVIRVGSGSMCIFNEDPKRKALIALYDEFVSLQESMEDFIASEGERGYKEDVPLRGGRKKRVDLHEERLMSLLKCPLSIELAKHADLLELRSRYLQSVAGWEEDDRRLKEAEELTKLKRKKEVNLV